MKKAILAAMTAPLLLSACGEKGEAPYFQVLGEAYLTKEAEIFQIDFSVSERHKDRLQSLNAASRKLDEIRRGLGRLDGLKRLDIATSKAQTKTIRPPGCDTEYSGAGQEYPGDCEPVAYITVIQAQAVGEPAGAAGDSLSLLTEAGAESARAAIFDVRDRKAAEMEVRQLALRDATETARALAKQSGARVGPPLDIKYGEGRYEERIKRGKATETTATPGTADTRTAPSVPLDLPRPAVFLRARVAVKFALEEPKAEK